jgi:hypothetical protein
MARPKPATFWCSLPGLESSAVRNRIEYLAWQTSEGRALALKFEGSRLSFKVADQADRQRGLRLVEDLARQARQGRAE